MLIIALKNEGVMSYAVIAIIITIERQQASQLSHRIPISCAIAPIVKCWSKDLKTLLQCFIHGMHTRRTNITSSLHENGSLKSKV